MTLDEIIAGMEHNARCLARNFLTAQTGNASECRCAKCQLLAFRAEMESMADKYLGMSNETKKRIAGSKAFGYVVAPFIASLEQDAAYFDLFAAELRAKIGEGK